MIRFWWSRLRGGWRCQLGVHRWVGHRDCGDGVNVSPYDGYAASPHRGAWRVCSWCGARSEAAYDPMYGTSFWWRRS